MDIIIIIFVLLLITGIIYNIYLNKIRKKDFISFIESLNLVYLPVITFKAGDIKLNFLFDTGASNSYIAKKYSNLVSGVEEVQDMHIISAGRIDDLECKMISSTISYNNKEYEVDLYVNDSLDESFKSMKEQYGITLHGILGTDFFSKHKYVLDFNKNVAYSKK